MRIAIVDDLRMDAEKLRGLLAVRLPAGTPIDLYDSGAALLASEAKHDLVFLGHPHGRVERRGDGAAPARRRHPLPDRVSHHLLRIRVGGVSRASL